MTITNERENDGQNRYIRISILDNDFCMIMKQNENDEVSKYQKCDKLYPNQHNFSPVNGFFYGNRSKVKVKVTEIVKNT